MRNFLSNIRLLFLYSLTNIVAISSTNFRSLSKHARTSFGTNSSLFIISPHKCYFGTDKLHYKYNVKSIKMFRNINGIKNGTVSWEKYIRKFKDYNIKHFDSIWWAQVVWSFIKILIEVLSPPKKMKCPRQSAIRQCTGPLALLNFAVNETASFFR